MSTSKARVNTRKAAAPKKNAAKAAPSQERFLILLRHGIAEEPTAAKRDEDRSLTAEGHSKMKEISRGLAEALPKTDAIYCSPLLRCVQTALWVSKGYSSKANVTTTDALAPGSTPEQFLQLVATITARRVVIVGHEPNLTRALAAITGIADLRALELKKGACYGVRIGADGQATFEWLLTPRVLRKMGE
jgi:phosphohistidine phosphatase